MHLAVLVRVATLLFIHPELFRGGMFHGAGVLASLFIVGNPFVLVVGFVPSYMPQMADVHIQAFEADAGGENAVGFVGLGHSVKEAVGQSRSVVDLGLTFCDDAVVLYVGKVAPNSGGEHVAGEVFAGHAVEDGGLLVLWGGLGLF